MTVRAVSDSRPMPDTDILGVADARLLPNKEFADAWASIVLGEGVKQQFLRQVAASIHLRRQLSAAEMPLHGILLLTGRPGVGKTTLARGLANEIAQRLSLGIPWGFIEVDPHGLAGAALGKSQKSVDQLFNSTIAEYAAGGPLVVLLDEVETLFTDRSQLSMEANPIDVHRAVNAGLVALDNLARKNKDLVIVATSNFAGAIDPALESRADFTFEVPLPDETARRTILELTLSALVSKFGGDQKLISPTTLRQAAVASDGLDGRQLRKAVAGACARDPKAAGDPRNLDAANLLATMKEWPR